MRVSVPCITPGAGPVRVRARRVQGKFPGTAVTVNARPWPVQPPSDTGGPTDPTTGPGTVPDSRLPLSDDAVQVTEAPLLVSASTQLPTSAPLNAPPGEIVHGGGIGGRTADRALAGGSVLAAGTASAVPAVARARPAEAARAAIRALNFVVFMSLHSSYCVRVTSTLTAGFPGHHTRAATQPPTQFAA